MTDDDMILLSRYLEGELSDEEQERTEARLVGEPAFQRAYEQLIDDIEGLRSLPLSTSPPPVLVVQAPPSKRARYAPHLFLAALAAAGWLFALWPASVLDVSTVQSVQSVQVEGRALISMEPPDARGRTASQEDSMHAPTAVISALSGAAITIAVYEGTARITGPDDSHTVVAGQSHRIEVPPVPTATPRTFPATPRDERQPLLERIRVLEAENKALQSAIAQASGDIDTLSGFDPIPWPADVMAELREEAFTDRVETALEEFDGVELMALDCSEYPCLAHLTETTPGALPMPASMGRLREALGLDELDADFLLGSVPTEDGSTTWALGLTDHESTQAVRARLSERLAE